MKKAKNFYRAFKTTEYTDGAHAKRIFKPGDPLPDGWETGHPGFKNFRADDEIMSQERKLKAKAAKYAKT